MIPQSSTVWFDTGLDDDSTALPRFIEAERADRGALVEQFRRSRLPIRILA
jgi:hypothetical protein